MARRCSESLQSTFATPNRHHVHAVSELRPSPLLDPYVRCYWTLEAPGSIEQSAQRVLPDGCVEIVINLGDQFVRHDPAGDVERQPHVLLVGPTTRHMTIAPTGSIRLIGIRFKPGGAMPFLAVPPHEVRDTAPALEDVVPTLGAALVDRLAATRPGGEAPVLDQTLGRRLARAKRMTDRRVLAAVRATYANRASMRVDALSAITGFGARQIERAFGDNIGAVPTTLERPAAVA